jgi:hypothetical protein
MKDGKLLQTIRTKGYWKTILRPLRHQPERIPQFETSRMLIEESQVALRGWYFPHIDRNGPIARKNSIESATDWEEKKEFLRFYQSGQFVHYFGFAEDWRPVKTAPVRDPELANSPILSVFSSLFSITERYEFAARLMQKAAFNEGIYIEIGLFGTSGRRLVSLDPERDLRDDYICYEQDLVRSRELPSDQLLGMVSELSLEHALWVFERFNWQKPPKQVLHDVQKQLLERRLT